MHRGIVSELIDNGFSIKTYNDEILAVVVTDKTQFLFEGNIEAGDMVIILGERDNHTIVATGVRKVYDKIKLLPKRHIPLRLHK